MVNVEHLPHRPSWDCLCCGKDWPCDTARESMAAEEGSRLHLAALMWSYLESFALDAGPGPLHNAFERFIGWTRQLTPPA